MREKLGEVIRYVLTGGMTTVVNYGIYFVLLGAGLNYLAANSLAWVGAVLFAYFANRKVVFRSDGDCRSQITAFVSLRLLTLLVENLLLLSLVDFCGLSTLLSKIMVSVITVVGNYFACKYHVFREGGVAHE